VELTLSENAEVTSGGQRILLEVGDRVSVDDASAIDNLRQKYKGAVDAGDTESAEAIATLLHDIGVKL
jgi:hypothetical protein